MCYNGTQRVQMDNVLSDCINIICGVLQESVLGPLKWCLYLLPLSANLMYDNIVNHVYGDDPQLYIYNLNVNSHWRQLRN